jgi:hypothetical protein
MSADYDSPWKEALDAYFEAFLALLFPFAHALIDWSRGYESLDKEFQQVVRDAEIGRRYVDKLVKVWLKDGVECWVLIHVEVQTTRDADFPLRMYVYHYRIFDRYNKPVASFAVLADDDPGWRPSEYRSNLLGCEAALQFPAIKLNDLIPKEAELEGSSNPFAKVVLAYLKARETKGDDAARYVWKIRLARGLFDQGFDAKDIRELFRIIDWLMELPEPLKDAFCQEVYELQAEKKMPYISSSESVGLFKGMLEGIETALKIRFGDEGLKLMPEIRAVPKVDQLRTILKKLETTTDIDEVRRTCLTP